MTTVKQNPPPEPRVTLSPYGDDGAIAAYPWKLYRVLLDGGRTLDVIAIRDDSDLRGEVLKFTKANKIEGVALVGPAPAPTSSKRTVTRKPAKGSG